MMPKKSAQNNALFDVSDLPRRPAGRHEQELDRAIEHAQKSGAVDALDAGLVSLARANAWALDEAEANALPYAVANLTPPFREVLAELGLTPAARNNANDTALNDALTQLLADDDHPETEISKPLA
ncbi:hypothetical protein NLL32_00695 [Corynebacterium propinquum]|uniref:terminase small subunit n=1 Tax=Corynebacterium propinquum TaxID=43769 RepID=UPI002542B507|nr:hypothetical protein [Corynebacterium propinquum]MDK4252613.1 hypothetical protein [Corynebacterium propinquum]WKS49450.1 hypothetical protein NLL32_00695 [Corynebacterium propinquum]